MAAKASVRRERKEARIDIGDCTELLEAQERTHNAERRSRDKANAIIVRGLLVLCSALIVILGGLVGIRLNIPIPWP